MSISEIATNGKPARRRRVRPEQVSLSVGRVEHLTIEVRNAAAITQLLDGIERRVAILEDGMPAVGGLTAQSARLSRVEEALRGNGAAHSIG
jgi:hypothetical protein